MTSRASGKSLRIVGGDIQGDGGQGKKGLSPSLLPSPPSPPSHFLLSLCPSLPLSLFLSLPFLLPLLLSCVAAASFTVHVRRKGVVALQNVKSPEAWLRINQGRVEGKVCRPSAYHRSCATVSPFVLAGKRRWTVRVYGH